VQIAPRTFYAWARRGPSRRAVSDAELTQVLAGYYEPGRRGRRRPESLYGAAKMWEHLNRRDGRPVARCTVERLMRGNGWRGIRRDRWVGTTVSSGAPRPGDLVQRHFHAAAPNRLFVADFTYVPLSGGGFAYTAFIIDAYAADIVGWAVATRANASLVRKALAFALETRQREGHPVNPGAIHHSDAGTQYTSVAFGKHLADAGMHFSIGSVGDAYDNALAESIIGLYKTECTAPGSPFHNGLPTSGAVEAATADWVHWYRTERIMHRLGRRSPAEAEADHYAQHQTEHPVDK
jgi:putative transposase